MRMQLKRHLVLALTLVLGCSSLPAFAQHDHHEEPDALTAVDLGTVEFQTSCSPTVKESFDRAVALLHSFWFTRSRAAFAEVLKQDPGCAMAHWGTAVSIWGNPFAGLRAANVIADGRQATDKAQSTGSPTARERRYIDALAILFSDANAATQNKRVLAYESAMTKLASDHPEDIEAQIFAALAISQAAAPDDKTYARQLQAGAILEPLFARMPKHPGLAHYIIHAYDVPPLAPKALPAAQAYADIAPAVAHALHMPSHTFTRVGMWRESVATNVRSAEAAQRANEPGAILHALDYMTYAYLQMGMDAQAKAAVARMSDVVAKAPPGTGAANIPGSFPAVAMPARYALERRDWKAAASLPLPSAANGPYIEAMARFARAVGAARSGKLDAVPAELERLDALRAQAIKMNDAYWAEIIDIERSSATAWHLFGQGKRNEGIAMMRNAATREDATEKSVVTPGPLAPAREMLGFMLIEADRPEEALRAFDAVMKKEPNRFLALYGAGQAAEKAQQRERAQRYYQQLVELCSEANQERPELAYARSRVKSRSTTASR